MSGNRTAQEKDENAPASGNLSAEWRAKDRAVRSMAGPSRRLQKSEFYLRSYRLEPQPELAACQELRACAGDFTIDGAGAMRDRFFHYVTHERAPDWLRCGWLVVIPNATMHHHHYGIVVEWLCDCKMVRPR